MHDESWTRSLPEAKGGDTEAEMGSSVVRGDEQPESASDCMALLGGASWGRCRAARASSASERVRLLPSRDVGSRMLIAGALSGLARGRVSCGQNVPILAVSLW